MICTLCGDSIEGAAYSTPTAGEFACSNCIEDIWNNQEAERIAKMLPNPDDTEVITDDDIPF